VAVAAIVHDPLLTNYFWHLDEGTFHALSSNRFAGPMPAN
jgi:hypothetical protein